MRPFSSIKTTLFNSSLGYLKITVESVGTTQKNGSYVNNSYISQNGVLTINPSTYLVFSYNEPNAFKSIYMSFPHIYRLREIFESLKDMVLGRNDAFEVMEGMYYVNPKYADPIVYANIGKKKQWISFRPQPIAKEDGVGNERGISIQISGNDNSSLLNADEIMTIYSIIKDLDLSAFHFNAGVLFVQNSEEQMKQPQGQMYMPQPQQYGGYQQQGYNPQPQGYAPQAPAAPRSGSYQGQQQASPRFNNQQQQRFSRNSGNPPAGYEQKQSTSAPVRANTGILSPEAIDDVPVESMSFDDIGVDDIFNPNN